MKYPIKHSYIFPVLLSCVWGLLSSCEDVIDVSINEGRPQLVVDAWITTELGSQTVTLSISQPYFDNNPVQPALGASVQVQDNEGNTFDFLDPDNDGQYIWQPLNEDEPLGKLGNSYQLTVTYQGETYQASSEINRVPPIDSITTEFREEELNEPEGYYAELFARDFPGSGDTYWIRTFKNGEFLNRGQDINIAFDAGFSAGGNIDGLTFISPIREGINPFREDDSDEIVSPYAIGDSIYVEIYSTSEDAFNYLQEIRTQLTNEGLFAVPAENVRTNVVNINPEANDPVLGYFGASAVSASSIIVQE